MTAGIVPFPIYPGPLFPLSNSEDRARDRRLRVAGYDDPFQRLTEQDFKDRYDNTPSPLMQDEFTGWLTPVAV